MVGLKNQGATCYMNSLLQSMYHTNEFRRGVYLMHRDEVIAPPQAAASSTGADGAQGKHHLGHHHQAHGGHHHGHGGHDTPAKPPVKSIPFALQRVFYRLQRDRTAPGTKELTLSFGWDSYEAFTQHDVQELNRVLVDNLEDKMKGTPAEGLIARLYEGEQTMFIEATDNPAVKSTRDEAYYDLQLNVKGCANVYESFEKFTEVEMMDGDNQWKVEDNPVPEYNGKHDARKGIRFKRFPPVLTLQLKRFEYDPFRNDMYKINDKYEFPEQLDLDRFLGPDAPRTVRNLYRLFAVLVHSGEAHGGHYYAYIRPDMLQPDAPWFKFDDERVTRVDSTVAIQESFGGDVEQTRTLLGQRITNTYRRAANAYMLVYMREQDLPVIQRPVVPEDIPASLVQKFEEEARLEEQLRKEREESHMFLRVRVATLKSVTEYKGNFDLISFDDPSVLTFKWKKDSTWADVSEELAQQAGVPVANIRLWHCVSRRNDTVRPEIMPLDLADAPDNTTLGSRHPKSYDSVGARYFLEPVYNRPPFDSRTELLLFFKWYDPETTTLRTLGCVYARPDDRLANLEPALASLCPQPIRGRPLLAFEEIRRTMVEPIDPTRSLANSEIETGDIIIWQFALPEDRASALQFPTAAKFLLDTLNRTVINFRRLDDASTNPQEFSLNLLLTMSYEEVSAAVAKELRCDPAKLRFTPPYSYSIRARRALHRRDHATLKQMVSQEGVAGNTLCYEILPLDLAEIEDKREMKVRCFTRNLKEFRDVTAYVDKLGCIENLLEEVARALASSGAMDTTSPSTAAVFPFAPPAGGASTLLLYEVNNHRISKLYRPLDPVSRIYDYTYYSTTSLVCEEVPPSEVEPLRAGAMRIAVAHHDDLASYARPFGVPMSMVVDRDETIAQLRARVRERLEVPEEEFAKWSLSFYNGISKQPEVPQPEDLLSVHLKEQSTLVVFGHPDKTPKTVTASKYERSIKIYN